MKKLSMSIAILFTICFLSIQATMAQVGSGSGIPELKEAQRKAMLAILAESKKKGEPLFTIIVDNRAEVEHAFTSANPDEAALQKHKAKLAEAMCKAIAMRWDAASRMMKLLTPEQKKFVAQMIKESDWVKDAYRVLLDTYELPDFAN